MNKIIKYGLVILRDGKFLINRKHGTKLFLMPGGKVENNETVEECLTREIREEHDVELVKDSIKYLMDIESPAVNEPNTMLFMKVYIGEIIGEPKVSSEIEEQVWFGKDDDQSILSPAIKNKILPELIKKNII